jgi:NitT/TauT family transport system substrate-binding protein
MNMRKPFLVAILILALLAGGCGAGRAGGREDVLSISVAEQYGLAYAPVQIMREMGYLEAALRDRATAGQPVSVQWVKLANTSAIREAMLAGEIDVAFTGIPPFLIGVDQGMPWRMITGLSACPVDLLVNDPEIKTLSDLVGNGRIALPQPGSIQHILLAMAAKRELGQADAFDRQLVSMKHPDGMQALLSGSDIVAHFTAPPYSFLEEAEAGIHPLLRGNDAMGEPYSFLVGIAEPALYEDAVRREAVRDALAQSMDYLAVHPEEAAALLAPAYGLTIEQTLDYLYRPEMLFQTDIHGVETFAAFMTEAGYLRQTPLLKDLYAQVSEP